MIKYSCRVETTYSTYTILRGQSDEYLTSLPDSVTIARKNYYLVVHCRKQIVSKFQPIRARSIVLTACGSQCVCRLYKIEKSHTSLWLDSCFWKGNRARKSRSTWMQCAMTLLLLWQPSKYCLASFHMVEHRFLISLAQVRWEWLPQWIKWQITGYLIGRVPILRCPRWLRQ